MGRVTWFHVVTTKGKGYLREADRWAYHAPVGVRSQNRARPSVRASRSLRATARFFGPDPGEALRARPPRFVGNQRAAMGHPATASPTREGAAKPVSSTSAYREQNAVDDGGRPWHPAGLKPVVAIYRQPSCNGPLRPADHDVASRSCRHLRARSAGIVGRRLAPPTRVSTTSAILRAVPELQR